jgi:hypothetical protein
VVVYDLSSGEPEVCAVRGGLPDGKSLDKPQARLKLEHNAQILMQITQIEAAQVRPTRELLIDPTNAFAKNKLATLDAQIVALRAQLLP